MVASAFANLLRSNPCSRRQRSRYTTDWRSFLTSIWKYRVLEIGQQRPSFRLRARRESSGAALATRIDAAECSNAQRRRAVDAFSPYSFRATGLTNFLEKEERWKWHRGSSATPTAAQRTRRSQKVLLEDVERISVLNEKNQNRNSRRGCYYPIFGLSTNHA
jgi:hypothetical protein